MSRLWTIIVILTALLTIIEPAGAQVTTATIYGSVVDPSGARIPGATVNLTQQETGSVMFNALNKVNLTQITTSINNAMFGQARMTRGQRVIRLNGRLSW